MNLCVFVTCVQMGEVFQSSRLIGGLSVWWLEGWSLPWRACWPTWKWKVKTNSRRRGHYLIERRQIEWTASSNEINMSHTGGVKQITIPIKNICIQKLQEGRNSLGCLALVLYCLIILFIHFIWMPLCEIFNFLKRIVTFSFGSYVSDIFSKMSKSFHYFMAQINC